MEEISTEEKNQLITIIQKYRNCFAYAINELGSFKATEMKITLVGDAPPSSCRTCRIASIEQQQVIEMVDELQLYNIILNCRSEYASPAFLIKKKTGDNRLCIDYRRLNARIAKDCYHLSRINDLVDQLSGVKFFISLNLKSVYYPIPLKGTSKKYIALIAPQGQFQ